jgi:hypothetical protein
MLRNKWLILFCFLILTSCGYQVGQDGVASTYHTLAVPTIKGDGNGNLASALVKEVGCSGCFEYRQDGAAAILQVVLLDLKDSNIGFRYDRHKLGKIRHTIIPTETRLTGIVEVSLVDACSGAVILGPVKLTASVDFDHDYYTSRNGVNIFSLGQLNDYDEAYDAALHPLNVILAQKIVDYICNSW